MFFFAAIVGTITGNVAVQGMFTPLRRCLDRGSQGQRGEEGNVAAWEDDVLEGKQFICCSCSLSRALTIPECLCYVQRYAASGLRIPVTKIHIQSVSPDVRDVLRVLRDASTVAGRKIMTAPGKQQRVSGGQIRGRYSSRQLCHVLRHDQPWANQEEKERTF